MTINSALLPYTVTLAGHERYDGEKPWTYVVNAEDAVNAVAIAAAYMGKNTGWTDLQVVSVIPGSPPINCGYSWNDLRADTDDNRRSD